MFKCQVCKAVKKYSEPSYYHGKIVCGKCYLELRYDNVSKKTFERLKRSEEIKEETYKKKQIKKYCVKCGRRLTHNQQKYCSIKCTRKK